ncbi:MAG: helix-turn-helix transcriptional regulator [Proteobacteria bacterium]|nr:helix-turn-helix transcriptional regulator [Pseudomonadota bacterium]
MTSKDRTRPTLGSALRSIRNERKWSLADASAKTGLSTSSWSKIENGQRSLTYDKLISLAKALDVDVTRLFSDISSDGESNPHVGRRSVHRGADGFVVDTGVYTYRYLGEELVRKRFLPVVMELHAKSVEDFEELLRHDGDEFAYVLEGEVELHTEVYAPLKLSVGDSVYFDSSVRHAYLNKTGSPAKILVIACEAEMPAQAREVPRAKAAARKAAHTQPPKARGL